MVADQTDNVLNIDKSDESETESDKRLSNLPEAQPTKASGAETVVSKKTKKAEIAANEIQQDIDENDKEESKSQKDSNYVPSPQEVALKKLEAEKNQLKRKSKRNEPKTINIDDDSTDLSQKKQKKRQSSGVKQTSKNQ